MKSRRGTYWRLILLLIGALLFFGGLGIEAIFVQYFGLLVGLLMLVLAGIWRGKLKLPPGVFLYGLFLILLAVSLVWSQDSRASFEYLTLFFGGGLFWLAFYNLREELGKGFEEIVIFLGIVFGGLYIAYRFLGNIPIRPKSLYAWSSAYKNHNHLGDLWALVLTIVAYRLVKTRKLGQWALLVLGGYFLAISLSRAAYVALVVGVLHVFWRQGWLRKYKKIFYVFILLATTLFIFASAQKTLLYSRPYFIQAIVGFIRNPLGVGLGSFGVISSNPANHLWGMDHYSSLVHNIALEILTGMGVLGLVFVFWLIRVSTTFLQNKVASSIVYEAVFFALGINFMFDCTYFIPTMIWLWFIVLGLSQKEEVHR